MVEHRSELTALTNYAKGCRCGVCKAASAEAGARSRERKRQRRTLIEGRWVATHLPARWHGDVVKSALYRCECVPCCEARGDRAYAEGMAAKARRASRSQRRAARRNSRLLVNGRRVAPLTVQYHGRRVAYEDWGCECLVCQEAKRGLRDAG